MLIYADHCLDLLRQTVTYYGDINPVPRPYVNDEVGWLSNTDRVRTSRSQDSIREWVAERAVEDANRQSEIRIE